MHLLGDVNLMKNQVMVRLLLISLLYPIENSASEVREFFSKKQNRRRLSQIYMLRRKHMQQKFLNLKKKLIS